MSSDVNITKGRLVEGNIPYKNIDTRSYMLNPVVFINHDYMNGIIGKTIAIEEISTGYKVTIFLYETLVKEYIKKGVSFKSKDIRLSHGCLVTRGEARSKLIEISIVRRVK